jgi:hypothetical protein
MPQVGECYEIEEGRNGMKLNRRTEKVTEVTEERVETHIGSYSRDSWNKLQKVLVDCSGPLAGGRRNKSSRKIKRNTRKIKRNTRGRR